MPYRVYLPQREWSDLGWRARRQVARSARHGRPHPDPHVAAVARAWAGQVPQRPRTRTRRQRIGSTASTVVAVALFTLEVLVVWGGSVASGTDPGVGDWRERRLARRILALPSSGSAVVQAPGAPEA